MNDFESYLEYIVDSKDLFPVAMTGFIVFILLFILLILIVYNIVNRRKFKKILAEKKIKSQNEEEIKVISGEDINATKLDLAQAYIDMGKLDTARTLLHEVLSQQDPAKKEEARQILKALGR